MADLKEVKNEKEVRASILDMAMGAIKERTDYEMTRIIENIQDTNTQAAKKRSLIIQIDFLPDEQRTNMAVAATVKSKTMPTAPVSTMLYMTADSNGEMAYVEATMQAPGQRDLFGGVQEPPKVLKLAK